MALEAIGTVLDPFNLAGFRQTENDKRRTRLIKAQEEYAKVWNEGEKKGLPMELMGFPKPVVQILSAGGGFSGGGGGGGAGFIPPIVPSQSGGGAVSESDIQEEEKKAEEITRVITSTDYVQE